MRSARHSRGQATSGSPTAAAPTCADAEAMASRIVKADWQRYHWPLFIGIEERWYSLDHAYLGNRQFSVQDIDGYLLRFFEHLGSRPKPPSAPGSMSGHRSVTIMRR